MSQIRLYLDEDSMRRSLVYGLRARSVDVLTAADAGMIGRDDQDHLATATASGRVLYTFNTADYCVLHQELLTQGRFHAGIIVAPQQHYAVGEELRRLMRLVSSVPAEDMQNRLEFLSSWS
ncbi:conserved hypothetical protein [Candidatus Sulfopaludibacter sp. SbA4]|nr:conserved hypothetical protein [Candidatus Sulfopaludibacter sp. SbA4]